MRPYPHMSVDPETMEELLASEARESSLRPLRAGETVEGTVAAISGDEATIDLGDRPAGVIAVREAGGEQLRVGEPVTATVVQAEGSDGRVVLSLRRDRHRRSRRPRAGARARRQAAPAARGRGRRKTGSIDPLGEGRDAADAPR